MSGPDIQPADAADVMTLTGYFYDTPEQLERVYKKRGVTHAVTRSLIGTPSETRTVWRYDGPSSSGIQVTCVGWFGRGFRHEHPLELWR